MNKLLLLGLCLLTTACATDRIVAPVVVRPEAPHFPQSQPAQQVPLQWVVITRENFEQRLQELSSTNQNFVVFAITPEGYENLNMNEAELRRYIQQQSAQIQGYQEYLAPPEQSHTSWFSIITH